jgi:hypothetical protein
MEAFTKSAYAAALVSASLCLGCEKPPMLELATAEDAFTHAQADGADRYAPERFHEAQGALADARKRVEEKDFRAARLAALDATGKSKGASRAAASAKALAKTATEMTEAEIRASLDEVETVQEEARKAKVPEEAFEDLLPRLQEVTTSLETLKGKLDSGEFLEAQTAAAELKQRAVDLPELVRKASETWQETHKRGRGPAKPSRRERP